MSIVGTRNSKTVLRRSLAEARHYLEQAVRERAPEGAIAALRHQIVDLLDN